MGKFKEAVKDLVKSGPKEDKNDVHNSALWRTQQASDQTVQFCIENKKGTRFMYSGEDGSQTTEVALRIAAVIALEDQAKPGR
jgi:hypothetical protein